ncbi:MAG: hypothetical protein ACRDEA_21440, partial [Microcystaceae cyanobacterium]
DFDADGMVDYRFSTTYTYDRKGNLTSQIEESDDDADGIVNSRYSTTYDSQGNITSRIDEQDFDDNGTVDRRDSTTYTYDSRGHLACTILGNNRDDLLNGGKNRGSSASIPQKDSPVPLTTQGMNSMSDFHNQVDVSGLPNSNSNIIVSSIKDNLAALAAIDVV